jgi:hypothetical protein
MLFTPVYDVRNRAFCGPTAISAVTGQPISEIRETIRETCRTLDAAGRKAKIMGVANSELLIAMGTFGWKVVEEMENQWFPRPLDRSRAPRYRFQQFLEEHGHDGPYVVNVTGHYIAVGWGEACDTYTKLPIEITRWNKARGRRWVQNWWKFAQVEK